jgi:hypothetical protein
MTSVVKAVKKIMLQLLSNINRARLQVNAPLKGITFQGTNKLLYLEIAINFDIIASIHKVSYMLLRIPFAIELLKLWWFIA